MRLEFAVTGLDSGGRSPWSEVGRSGAFSSFSAAGPGERDSIAVSTSCMPSSAAVTGCCECREPALT